MSATFVQVDSALLADPAGLERLFVPDFAYAAVDSAQMRAQLERSVQLMAQSHPELREQLDAQLAQMYSGNGDAKRTEGCTASSSSTRPGTACITSCPDRSGSRRERRL